jgi:MFS family permease
VPRPFPPERAAWYVVFVLTLVYSISYVDRQMLSLLVAPIKRDFGIKDADIGMLTGPAFAVTYAVLGIVLAQVADTRNRVSLIMAGLTSWSIATGLTGFARNFTQLFAARVAVGAGEASLTPTAYSLFSDYFPPARLGKAVAVYTLAQYIGMGIALLLGGLLVGRLAGLPPISIPGFSPFQPWQIAMMVVCIPGLFALPLLRTIKEPRAEGRSPPNEISLRAVWARFRAMKLVYLTHFTGFSLAGLYATGLAAWLPEFFRRTYGWPVQRTGLALALVLIGVGGPSTLAGGWIADRLRERRRYAAPIWIAVAALLAMWPLAVWLPLAATAAGSLLLLGLVTMFLTLPTAVAPTALQLVTPPTMRARMSAIYLFCTNLIGTGAGPWVVGLTTDHVFGTDAALNRSLSVVAAVICPLAALTLFAGRRAFARAALAAAAEEPLPAAA